MGFLTRAKEGAVEHFPATLSDRLQWLCQYGKPRLSFFGDGWRAVIEMTTNVGGSEFRIASEFRHATPDEAVSQVIERMLDALSAATKESRSV